jgi:predicted DNA-binding protein
MAKGVKGSSPEIKPVRTSFILSPVISKKLNYISFQTEKDKTAIVDDALNEYIRKYEKKHGDIVVK